MPYRTGKRIIIHVNNNDNNAKSYKTMLYHTYNGTLYISNLAAPFTVNTMPEATLKAFADHGEVGSSMSIDGGDSESVLAEFARSGVNVDTLAAQLQDEGAKAFVKSWNELLGVIASKSAALKQAA